MKLLALNRIQQGTLGGGGKGYRYLVNQGDYQVKTAEELLTALKQAKAGRVVYVYDRAEIDLTGKQKPSNSGRRNFGKQSGQRELPGRFIV